MPDPGELGGPIDVCVVGAGGLGCPLLLSLSAAGGVRLTIVDHDRVEAHNLQRQVLYCTADVGRPKVEAAAHRLRARVPDLRVTAIERRLRPQDTGAFVAGLPAGTVLCEATDDPALKFAFNDAALARGVPLVIGAALGFRGQALAVAKGHACYRCIYEAPPPVHAVPTCAQAGVLGAGVGLVGHLMAALALGLAADPPAIAGRLHTIDLRRMLVRTLEPAPRPGCPACRAAPLQAAHDPGGRDAALVSRNFEV